jgi:hypothetical protein
MPASYEIVGEKRCLRITCTGTVTGDELLALSLEVEANRAAHPMGFCLVDLTGAAQLLVTRADVERFVDVGWRLAALSPAMAVAVAAPADLAFGMARMWEMMSTGSGWRTCVFRSLAEAERWLTDLGLHGIFTQIV